MTVCDFKLYSMNIKIKLFMCSAIVLWSRMESGGKVPLHF